VDYRAKLPGRGAWVVPEREVFLRLESQPKLLQRAFRCPVRATGILSKVLHANSIAVEHALSLAARSGCLVSGGKRVRDALAEQNCLGVLFAEDASPRLRRDLLSRNEGKLGLEIDLDRAQLGAQIGKGPRAAVAIMGSKPGRHLIRELQRHRALR
jgi:ribosomal protein L7Ae-like RNA K-turn-binding protein